MNGCESISYGVLAIMLDTLGDPAVLSAVIIMTADVSVLGFEWRDQWVGVT